MEKQLLIVHPYDKSTNFLDRIKNHLQAEFPENSHYFNVKPNNFSHEKCLSLISDTSKFELIFFMGHGKSNSLCGAKGDYYRTFENEEVKAEAPEKYYYQDNFINGDNFHIFADKKIISLSCNSNGQIGRKSIENGARVFLGFGDLPTSIEELKEKGEEGVKGVSLSKIVKALKTEIIDIIKKSIVIAIHKKYSFSQLVDLIHFLTNQKISNYLVIQKKISERKLIANYLYTFKKEIKIYGNKEEIVLL